MLCLGLVYPFLKVVTPAAIAAVDVLDDAPADSGPATEATRPPADQPGLVTDQSTVGGNR